MYFKGNVLSVKEKRGRTFFGPSTGKGKVVKKKTKKKHEGAGKIVADQELR